MSDPRIRSVHAAIQRVGETVIVRRVTGISPQIPLDIQIKAVVRDYTAQELLGGLQQGDRHVTISQLDMENAQWCWPVKIGDRIIIDNRTMMIKGIENRKIGNDIAMVVLQVRG